MSDNNNDFGAFLVGFIVGGLTGAAVSLLFAPQSGEETRKIIQDKAIELRDRASETVEEARLRAEEAWEGQKRKQRNGPIWPKKKQMSFAKKARNPLKKAVRNWPIQSSPKKRKRLNRAPN